MKTTIAACLVCLICMANSGFADPTFSDFSFGSGSPNFGGTKTVGGVDVTLVSTNTEPLWGFAFRDLENTNPSPVTFTFSAPITSFHLDISKVRADEVLTSFNIGTPTSLSGTLTNIGGSITTSGFDDEGAGRLSWEGIQTNVVSFVIGNVPNSGNGPALAVERFGFTSPNHLRIRFSSVELCWDTTTNTLYQLQYRSAITLNQWIPLDPNFIAGNGSAFCTNDIIRAGQQSRFYRLVISNLPPQL
jgi:hypothetical protein